MNDINKDGVITTFYANGKKSTEETYKDRKLVVTWWNKDGQKSLEKSVDFSFRRLYKKPFDYSFLYATSVITTFYANGKKRKEETYKEETYKDRKLVITWWNKDGQKSYEAIYKNGKKVSTQLQQAA